MDRDKPEQEAEKVKAQGGERRSKPDSAFDIWLERGLRAMYDDVAREPIPPELLRLIEQDRNS